MTKGNPIAIRPRFLDSNAHKQQPVIANFLERLGHQNLESHQNAVRFAMQDYLKRRAQISVDNRKIKPELRQIWQNEVEPHLSNEHRTWLRKEITSQLVYMGSAYHKPLVQAVENIVEREQRLLQTRGLMKKLSLHELAEQLVSGIVHEKVDARHDELHNLKPQQKALRQAALTRHQTQVLTQNRIKELFKMLTNKPKTKKMAEFQKSVGTILKRIENPNFDYNGDLRYYKIDSNGEILHKAGGYTHVLFQPHQELQSVLESILQKRQKIYRGDSVPFWEDVLLALCDYYGQSLTLEK